MKRINWTRVSLLLLCLITWQTQAESLGWSEYKQHFILPEGRVVDNGNNQISHSEGQGYGMILADVYDDKETFDQLWNWTKSHLQRQDNSLFSWRYDPQKHQVSDRNDATDGDVLIGWALLRAGQHWNNHDYLLASENIQRSLLRSAIVTWSDKHVMLPGVDGFKHPNYINLNPSYFIFPAWNDFYHYSHSQQWKTLIDDGLVLLANMRFGEHRLPTDWVAMQKDGKLSPAEGWPARFSYDAVRIPLYLNWYSKKLPQNTIFTDYWGTLPAANTPAWVDIGTHVVAEYPLSPGMRAVRYLATGDMWQVSESLESNEDYYSASLKLLALAASRECCAKSS
ncbi:glycosyl hydrolase family 8 [Hafnia alvei]|uniref:glycosyl hydrolase family 8 n=1 Tax=Hafnia alvei TaxID=569 RepID=UPI001413430A|nr:glycosyl hydrolase family 8 [Hafnia alvei]QIP54764.1 endoglucanase [Hafnia alvei]